MTVTKSNLELGFALGSELVGRRTALWRRLSRKASGFPRSQLLHRSLAISNFLDVEGVHKRGREAARATP